MQRIIIFVHFAAPEAFITPMPPKPHYATSRDCESFRFGITQKFNMASWRIVRCGVDIYFTPSPQAATFRDAILPIPRD